MAPVLYPSPFKFQGAAPVYSVHSHSHSHIQLLPLLVASLHLESYWVYFRQTLFFATSILPAIKMRAAPHSFLHLCRRR